jgi:O-antigen biosynthesis protein WbqP
MKRIFDVVISFISGIVLLIPLMIIALILKSESKGPVFFWSDRVGKGNVIFKMPKFRTMRKGIPVVATHLLTNATEYITPMGSFLRKTSLDELPQLWSILIGDMSLVGPRPALFNQEDLISLRKKYGIESLTPGLTGWAQVNGRDELSIAEKVRYDAEYLKKQSFWFDVYIIILTLSKVIRQSCISH